MALQTSGAISLSEIQTEFGGENPISISEYYGEGTLPASGEIAFSDFYGQSAENIVTLNIYFNTYDGNYDLWNFATTSAGTDYVEGSTKIILNMSGQIYQNVGTKTAYTAFIANVPSGDTFELNVGGSIIGAGGSGGAGANITGSSLIAAATNGSAGLTALRVFVCDGTVNVNVQSGALISSGGGGGGGGAAGVRQSCGKRGCSYGYYDGCGGGGGAGYGDYGVGIYNGGNGALTTAGSGGVYSYSGNGGAGGTLGNSGYAGSYYSNPPHPNATAQNRGYGGGTLYGIWGVNNIDNYTNNGTVSSTANAST